MPYVIAPLDDVKGENAYPEYREAMAALEVVARKRADAIWGGYSFGGLYPGDNQYGMCPLRQNEMANDVSSTTLSGSYTYRKNVTATGWRGMFNYSTRKDVMHAFAGFKVTEEVLRIAQLRIEISDRLYPIFDIQEAKDWKRFAIIFKEDEGAELIAQPESRVLVRAYFETAGYQTLVPLGFQLYKRKDLVITET